MSVLRLRPGDLLVAHISEELGELEGLAESVVDAVETALRKSGHDKVGSLIVAGEIRFEIVRQEGASGPDLVRIGGSSE